MAAIVAACNEGQTATPAAAGTRDEPPSLAEPVTVFSVRELFLAGEDVRIAPPLTPGSALNPRALDSAAPEIVSIDSDGMLHTHAEGTARIRSTSLSELVVHVRRIRELRLVPDPVELRAGDTIDVRVKDGDAALPAGAVEWLTDDPAIVSVSNGRLSGGKPGSATVIARVGDIVTRVKATVHGGRPPFMALSGPSGPLRPGMVVQFEGHGPAGVLLEWNSTDSRVLRLLSGGVFQAMQSGRAQACIKASGFSRCTPVEVEQ